MRQVSRYSPRQRVVTKRPELYEAELNVQGEEEGMVAEKMHAGTWTEIMVRVASSYMG